MKKLLLSSLVATSIFAFAYTSVDVENANFLANKGIILKQSSAGKYRFADTITRAEVIGMALKIKGVILPDDYQCKKYFSDVTKNDWVCRAVEISADEGLTSRNNTKFRPQDSITRAEALAILVKSGGITYPKNVVRDDDYFPDSTPQWIVDLVSGGLVGVGTFPDDPEFILQKAIREEIFNYAKNILENNINHVDESTVSQKLTLEDGWDIYMKYLSYIKSSDMNGLNSISYEQFSVDCNEDCKELHQWVYKLANGYEKKDFAHVYADTKQLLLTTDIISDNKTPAYYTITKWLFYKDAYGQIKFLIFGNEGHNEKIALLDSDNDGLSDKDENCEGIANKTGCTKTDPKNPDTNDDGWWDGIEKIMNKT